MNKARTSIPKATREAILKEFNHRCAICGADRPQMHHIDENPSNNNTTNLIPLCPNCHLTDQHNPTTPIEPDKLRLFRQFKDPAILKPQFHPLFARMRFLNAIDYVVNPFELEMRAEEIAQFVAALEMGAFYSNRIREILYWHRLPTGAVSSDPEIDARIRYVDEQREKEYREHLHRVRNQVFSLVVELLRFQKW